MDEAHRPLKPGDPEQLGRFRIVSRLGAGGMGVAYLAKADDGATAVVKAARSDFADDPDVRRRFRLEVMASIAVESPFVPDVLASDLSAERQWVAIEYIEGPTLAELVRDQGPLTPSKQYALAAALADGLAQLHANGLIHRDVKPSNIICAKSGPRLIDFGIAIRENVRGATRTGALSPGSPGWLAPEQLDPFAAPTAAIDIFAWGCICWYAATGRTPFTGATSEDSIRNLRAWRSTDAVPPASMHPTLTSLVRPSLVTKPTDRPTAASIAGALSDQGGSVTSQLVATAWDPTAATSKLEDLTRDATLREPHGWEAQVRRRRRILAPTLAAAVVLVALIWVVDTRPQNDFTDGVTPVATDRSSAASPPAPEAPVPSSAPPTSPEAILTKEPLTEQAKSPKSEGEEAELPSLPGYGGSRRVGYGAVKLGMTRAELEATGETTGYDAATGGSCVRYWLRAGGAAFFSVAQQRVVAIEFTGPMATSKGIRIGSTGDEVYRAYPDAPVDRLGTVVAPVVPPHVYYQISIFDDRVELIVLASDRQDCAE